MTETKIEFNEVQCQLLALGIGDYITISANRTVVFHCENGCPLLLSDSQTYNHGHVVRAFLISEVTPDGNTVYNVSYDIRFEHDTSTGSGACKLLYHVSFSPA